MPTTTAVDDVAELKRTLADSLRKKMRTDKISVAELARQMGTARTAVRRILDQRNTSITLNSIGKAARAAGLRIAIHTVPMAPEQIDVLAHRLAAADDPVEKARLKKEIIAGFYGDEAHA